ncbi:sugar transferase [Enterococcus faecium]|nr:sugar transferase [Enterococcus faecium]MDL0411575.1 sugar transferase [Enterococcus faecium]
MDGPFFKIKEDSRVTRVGKFIRKTSIDELHSSGTFSRAI